MALDNFKFTFSVDEINMILTSLNNTPQAALMQRIQEAAKVQIDEDVSGKVDQSPE